MSDADLELPDELPEMLQAHAALGVAVMALELIRDGVLPNPAGGAAKALELMLRRYPALAQNLTGPPIDDDRRRKP